MFYSKRNGLLLFIVAAFAVLAAPANAEARDINLNVKFSGGVYFTMMDANGDGGPDIYVANDAKPNQDAILIAVLNCD